MISRGEIAPGARVNEVRLAAALGVSRTPVREALNRLQADGFLDAQPRRGFFAPKFSAAELKDAYRLRPILDCAALENAGLPDRERLDRLVAINRQFARARGIDQRIDLDDAFHLTLIGGCGNKLLLDLVGALIARTRRYEHAYLSDAGAFEQSGTEHDRILSALASENLAAAVAALRENLSSGLEPMLCWLNKRSREKK